MLDKDVLSILVCPECKSRLIKKQKSFVCSKCDRVYPIKDGIPILISNSGKIFERARVEEHFEKKAKSFGTEIIRSDYTKKRIKCVIGLISSGSRLLDLGCGRGMYAFKVKDRYKQVVGVDTSISMLKYAKKRINNAICGDCFKLPFKDKSFDTIIAIGLIDYFKDPKPVLDEMNRVLENGGEIILSVAKKYSIFVPYRILSRVFKEKPKIYPYTLSKIKLLMDSTNFKIMLINPLFATTYVVKANK